MALYGANGYYGPELIRGEEGNRKLVEIFHYNVYYTWVNPIKFALAHL